VRTALLASTVLASSHPALAQWDMTGLWRPLPRNQDGSGIPGDAAGIPLSQEGRWRGDTWSPEDFDLGEWVCRPHAPDTALEGPLASMRVSADLNRTDQEVVSYHVDISPQELEVTIWMDGRPRPSASALHSWSGFSTGEWDGDMLVVTTTHVKETYIRRTGLMRSDQTTVRTRWRRIGDYLQATVITYDPVYLSGPYIRSTMTWVSDPRLVTPLFPCDEPTETAVPRGEVRHYLPGTSPMPALNPKLADRFGTPFEARLGGPETMYPEYIAKMKSLPRLVAPAPTGGKP
jgi:hypothetical protein